MANRTKLGRRQVEILEALNEGNQLQLTGSGKRARVQFVDETEVAPPNQNALNIYHERSWVKYGQKGGKGKPSTFEIGTAGQAALAAHQEAISEEASA